MKDTTSLLVGGHLVTIRPIRPTDLSMEAEFVSRLSSQTKHYRFFNAFKELPVSEIRRFCNVDGCQSMAFVATVKEGDREVEIGVCRYAPSAKSDVREMAVTIADNWQHSDLDRVLLEHLIESARQYEIRELYTVELSDNRAMHNLAQKFGMSTRRDPDDATQVIYSLPLKESSGRHAP
jgi:hypothetical protein